MSQTILFNGYNFTVSNRMGKQRRLEFHVLFSVLWEHVTFDLYLSLRWRYMFGQMNMEFALSYRINVEIFGQIDPIIYLPPLLI